MLFLFFHFAVPLYLLLLLGLITDYEVFANIITSFTRKVESRKKTPKKHSLPVTAYRDFPTSARAKSVKLEEYLIEVALI